MSRCTWKPNEPGYDVDCRKGTAFFIRAKGRPGCELHCPGCGELLVRTIVIGETQGRLA